MKHALIVAGLLALPLMSVAHAADAREGAAYWQNVTVVNLTGEARRTVTPDKITASLAIEKEAKEASAAQAFINGKMQLAKVAAGDVAGVKFETGGYNTYQINNQPVPLKDGTKPSPMWHARQEVTLSGGNPEDFTKLVGQLQNLGFGVNNLSYTLSQEKADKVQEELVGEALDDIKQKAQKIAAHLGLKTIRYASINTGGESPRPVPMMRAMAMKAEMASDSASPVVTPGTTEVVVNIGAEVHLR